MRNIIRLITVVLFMALLIVPTVVWLFVRDNPEINYDLGENRNLASFPDSFSGNGYPAEIEQWYNDNLPFRSVLNTADSVLTYRLDSYFERFLVPEEEPVEEIVVKVVKETAAPEPPPAEPAEPTPAVHSHMYYEVQRLDETCTETGFSVYACSCGDSFRVDRPAKGHNYETDSLIPATCTEEGTLVLVCSRCGDTVKESIPAHGHDFEVTQEGSASCIEDSIVTFTCRRCGYSYSEETKGLGHSWTLVESSEASCTADGFMRFACGNCNETMEEIIPATGHNYIVVEHEDATCMTDGHTVFRCTSCGDTYTDMLVHGHLLQPVETVAASYEDYGYVLNICSRCGAEVRTDIADRLESTTKKAMKYHNQITIEGRYGWLFYQGDDSEKYYKGTNILTEKQMQSYSNAFRDLDEVCRKLGKKLVVLIAPNKEQVYPEFYPTVQISDNRKRVQRIVEHVGNTTDVSILYPLKELTEAKPYWQTYFKLDTHWNEIGGLIGTQSLYREIGLETTDIQYLPIVSYDRGQGDLVNLGNLKTNRNYVHDTGYHVGYRPEVDVTRYDLSEDGTILQTSADNAPIDMDLVLISDSFREAMIPYLTKDFANTTIIHRSSIDDTFVRQAVLDSDIIVIAAVERYETELLDVASKVRNMLGVLLK